MSTSENATQFMVKLNTLMEKNVKPLPEVLETVLGIKASSASAMLSSINARVRFWNMSEAEQNEYLETHRTGGAEPEKPTEWQSQFHSLVKSLVIDSPVLKGNFVTLSDVPTLEEWLKTNPRPVAERSLIDTTAYNANDIKTLVTTAVKAGYAFDQMSEQKTISAKVKYIADVLQKPVQAVNDKLTKIAEARKSAADSLDF